MDHEKAGCRKRSCSPSTPSHGHVQITPDPKRPYRRIDSWMLVCRKCPKYHPAGARGLAGAGGSGWGPMCSRASGRRLGRAAYSSPCECMCLLFPPLPLKAVRDFFVLAIRSSDARLFRYTHPLLETFTLRLLSVPPAGTQCKCAFSLPFTTKWAVAYGGLILGMPKGRVSGVALVVDP